VGKTKATKQKQKPPELFETHDGKSEEDIPKLSFSNSKRLALWVKNDLVQKWARFVGSGAKSSRNGNGAMVLWMACQDLPNLREETMAAALTLPPEEAVRVVRTKLYDYVMNKVVEDEIARLPRSEQIKLVKDFQRKR